MYGSDDYARLRSPKNTVSNHSQSVYQCLCASVPLWFNMRITPRLLPVTGREIMLQYL